jgi:hypothetical protein
MDLILLTGEVDNRAFLNTLTAKLDGLESRLRIEENKIPKVININPDS